MPIVTNGARGHTVVVNRDRNIATVQQGGAVVRVQDRASVAQVRDRSQVQQVAAPGPQGPRGEAGLSASGALPPITFHYGDATPDTILVLAATSEVTEVSLQIEEAFDGAGAQIKLGTAEAPGLLMDAWQNDPTALLNFEVSPRVELPAGTPLVLTITPGAGASQGRGQFVINAVATA